MSEKWNLKTEEISSVHKRRVWWYRVVSVLAALAVFVTTYILILPALTLTNETFCGYEEHTHGESCFNADGELICEKPEHIHTLICHSDPEADTEEEKDWEEMFINVALTDDARANLLAVAGTQLGYKESKDNFSVDEEENTHGYTRYGAWAGEAYADWNAEFIAFCLKYAGVLPEGIKEDASPEDYLLWLNAVADAEDLSSADEAAAGDIVLTSDEDGAVRFGVVIENRNAVLQVISGDMKNEVSALKLNAVDPKIVGVVSLENADVTVAAEEESEEPTTEEPATEEPTTEEPTTEEPTTEEPTTEEPTTEEPTTEEPTTAVPETKPAPAKTPERVTSGTIADLRPAAELQNTGSVVASGSVNNNMTWTLYEDGELVISGTGGMNVVPWRPTYNDAIKKVTIEEGVTSVGNSAFSGCENLTEVSLPSTLTTIGDSAFQDCTGLTEMQFPAALTSVGRNGFNGCTALASIDFPADGNINRLYPAAFYGCTSLTAVSIPASMQILDTSAFGNCSALETVDFAEGSVLTRVVNATFQNCTSLRSITLPPTVTELSQNTFNGCTSLESVTLSPKLTSIGTGAFNGCTSLTEVIFPEGSVLTSLSNGAFQNCSSLETITLPDSLTTLGSAVFSGCTSLTTVGVPDSLTAIGSSAFSNCTSLSSFRFPASLRTIDNNAFYNTAALEEADFSACSSLTTLGQSAFYQSGIKTLDLSNCSSLTSIPAYCFELCKNLETVDLTGCTALTTVGYRAFEGDSALKGIDFSSCTALKSFDSQVFSECSNLQYANFTGCESLTTFAAQDFQYCSKLESLDFSGCTNLTSFSYNNFRNCTSLKTVSFAGCEKLTSLSYGTFPSCPALETVDLSGCVSLKALEQGLFQNCTSLRSVNLSGCTAIKSIDNSAFYGCTSLQEIDLSDCSGITTIGPSAFSGCSSLREIDLSGMTSLTSIGSNAFYKCSKLQTVDLTDCSALTTIGSSAFQNCSSLNSVILDGCTSLRSLGTSAFDACSSLREIDLSSARDSLVTIGQRAFTNSALVEIDLHDFKQLTTVDIQAFDGCQKLEIVNFNGCSALKSLGGNSYMIARQFYNTPVLKLLDLRGCSSLETIGSESFSTTRTTLTVLLDGCTSLKYIYSDAFAGHGAAVELDLSQLSSLELIGSNAFVRGKFIGTLVIPEKVKTIGSSAFGNNTGYGNWNQFSKIDLSKSESLETIGSYAFGYLPVREVDFSGCTSLVSIGTGAFRNDLALNTADLSNCVSLTTIGDAAFRDCTALEEVTIPVSVTSLAETAFMNDSAVKKLTWNAVDYPTVLGAKTFTTANGFSNGYELHIGADTNALPENFFNAVSSCGDIYFDGENEVLSIPAAASAGAPAPISDIDGMCYVDEYGVVYELSDDGSTAKVAYCPPGITAYTVPAHITVGGEEIPVIGVNPSAFILARDLTHVTFEDASAITEMGASAFYGVGTLTAVTDAASGRTETSVSGAVALFTNAVVGSSVFKNTGLTDDNTDRPWTDGNLVPEIKYNDGALRLEVSVPAQNSVQGAGWTLVDGEYRYLTGAYYNAVVSAANDANHPVTARVYFDFSNINHIGMDTSFVIEGSDIAVTLHDTADPDVKYYEFTLAEGETASFSLYTTFPSPNTPGGDLHIWVTHPENEDAAPDPARLAPEDDYIGVEWVTRRQDRKVTKTYSGTALKAIGDGEGGPIAGITAAAWTVDIPNTGETADPNYGKDLCYEVKLTDTLTLPEAVHWNDTVLAALNTGRYETRTAVSGTNRVGYLTVTDEEGVRSTALSITVPNTATLNDFSIEPVTNEGGEIETVILHWTLKAKTENKELATAATTISIPANVLTLHLDELQENYGEIVFPLILPVHNEAEAAFSYRYSEKIESAAAADNVITAPAANLTFAKARASGTSANYTTYMGLDETFTLTVSNLNTGSTTGLRTVSDPMTMFMYIKPENMERMFADPYGKRLTITISNAELYTPFAVEGIGIDGSPVILDPENSDTAGPVATAQTIVIRPEEEGYAVYVEGQTPAVYATVREGLDAIGYVVTGGDLYTTTWTFTEEDSPFIFYGGMTVNLPIYLSHKTSLGLLTQDWHHHYDCENDWIGTMSNTARMYYDTPSGETRSLSASAPTYKLRYDLTIGKGMTRNGEEVVEPDKVNFADGDELTYTLRVRNRGAAITDMPLVDDSTGAQVILVPVDGNEDVDWGASGTPDVYTALDGSLWYVLDREGEWHNVTVGVDEAGKVCIADTVSVEHTFDAYGEISGYTTQIKWYYPTFPTTGTTAASYKTVTYRALVRTNKHVQYSFHNIGWINDKPGDRLYAEIGAGGSILLFDKQIVTANANIDGHTAGETLAPNDYSALTEKNHVVTYKITLRSDGEGKILLRGNDIFDRLPQTFGIFDWSQANVTLSYRTDDPEHVFFTGMDDWYISTSSPIPAFWENDVTGQFYIRWPSTSSVEFTEVATAYLYVTLNFTDAWEAYCLASAGNSVENVVYVNDYPENVVHDIVGQGSVVLQKGVNLIRKAGLSKTREFYDNAYSHLEYYVVLYNGGNTRLYLQDMVDTLPRGFAFRRVDAGSDEYFRDSHVNYSTTTYSDADLTAENPKTLPVQFSDEHFNVRFKSVAVSAAVTGDRLVFHLTGSKTDDRYAAYDENYDAYYLRTGEAIVFCYTVAIDPDYDNTDDVALNRISMPYLDPQSTGLTVYEGAAVNGKALPEIGYNDGNCFITSPEMGVEYLNSEVTVRRGEILPGVNKRLTGFVYGGNEYPVYSEEDAVDPLADLNWEIDTYNEGTAAINGYSLVDVMQYPYRFGGEVRYLIYDLDGISVSSGVYDTSGTILQPLFTITGHTETEVTLRDNAGATHTVAVNGDPATLNLPLVVTNFNGVSRTRYTETPYYGNTPLRGTVDVSFAIDPETKAETMRITFPEGIMIHFPGCVGKLTLSTLKANTGLNNTTYVNTAFFGPADTAYAAYLVDKGMPIVDENGDNEGVESYGFVTVRSGWATNSRKTVTEDLRPTNTATSLEENNVITLLGEESTFTYRLIVKNTNDTLAMDRILFLDNLPKKGDVYTLQPDIERYSEFTVDFADELDLTVMLRNAEGEERMLDPAYYTVEFSDKEVFDTADWNGGGDGWSTTRSAASRSLRVMIDDSGREETDERLIPPGGTVTIAFRAKCGEGAAPGLIAYNGFAYRYSINNIFLEASPLLVGVRVPDFPHLIKHTVDRYGRLQPTQEDTAFRFLAYEGDPVDLPAEEIPAFLEAEGRAYKIYEVTVPAGRADSGRVKLLPDEDAVSGWQWIQGNKYSITELPYGREYAFSRWTNAASDTVTFIFDNEKTQVFTAENKSSRWDLTLTKVDRDEEETRLSGAVFAMYSPNPADAVNEETLALYNASVQADATYTDGAGNVWYLCDLLETDENGLCSKEGLLEETYLLIEVKAPVGYNLLSSVLRVSAADLESMSLSLLRLVPNEKTALLPQTGGVGVYLPVAAGLFLLLLALAMVLVRRRRLNAALRG